MKKSKKKITAIALLIAILAIAVAGGTLAYFTDDDSATNTFAIGNVKIDLREIGKDGTTVLENTGDSYTDVTPGIEMSKQPYVVNMGNNDAFIRVDVTVDKYYEFKHAAEAHGITDLGTIFSGHNENSWYRFGIDVDGAADTATYKYLYGYYDGSTFQPTRLSGHGSYSETPKLFTGVTVPKEFTSAEMEAIGNFNITLDAFAIQADLDTAQGGTDTLVAQLEAMTK